MPPPSPGLTPVALPRPPVPVWRPAHLVYFAGLLSAHGRRLGPNWRPGPRFRLVPCAGACGRDAFGACARAHHWEEVFWFRAHAECRVSGEECVGGCGFWHGGETPSGALQRRGREEGRSAGWGGRGEDGVGGEEDRVGGEEDGVGGEGEGERGGGRENGGDVGEGGGAGGGKKKRKRKKKEKRLVHGHGLTGSNLNGYYAKEKRKIDLRERESTLRRDQRQGEEIGSDNWGAALAGFQAGGGGGGDDGRLGEDARKDATHRSLAALDPRHGTHGAVDVDADGAYGSGSGAGPSGARLGGRDDVVSGLERHERASAGLYGDGMTAPFSNALRRPTSGTGIGEEKMPVGGAVSELGERASADLYGQYVKASSTTAAREAPSTPPAREAPSTPSARTDVSGAGHAGRQVSGIGVGSGERLSVDLLQVQAPSLASAGAEGGGAGSAAISAARGVAQNSALSRVGNPGRARRSRFGDGKERVLKPVNDKSTAGGEAEAEQPPKPMTMEDWKRMEKLFTSGDASGPEALAFKMVRDAMLNPSYAAEFRNLTSTNAEQICDLPTSDPDLCRERDALDGPTQFMLRNAACSMRVLLDPFHHASASCGDFCNVDENDGSVAGVIHGRTMVKVVPPPGRRGDVADLASPGNCVRPISGVEALRFHDKSVSLDPTFLRINEAVCPALKRELDKYSR